MEKLENQDNSELNAAGDPETCTVVADEFDYEVQLPVVSIQTSYSQWDEEDCIDTSWNGRRNFKELWYGETNKFDDFETEPP